MHRPVTQESWVANPAGRGWSCPPPAENAIGLHRRLPGYAPTPLREAPGLAAELGVGRVFVKDESSRFDLGAFKFLGASWAVFRALAEAAGFAGQPDLEQLRAHLAATADGPITVVSATDGNHGRAVARMAVILGVRSEIFIPRGVPELVVDRVRREGAAVTVVDRDYDGAIAAGRDWADRHPGAVIVQDTSWDGYEQIPSWIVEGYSTLFLEIDEQLAAAGVATPSVVAVPVGVGSLAQAAVEHYRSTTALARPRLLAVEPDTAACVLASIRAGRLLSVDTDSTIMNGLNCGTPSLLAWPSLRDGLDAVVAVTDEQCRAAQERLADAGIPSGPSGAAAYAGVAAALSGPDGAAHRDLLALDERSVLVLLSTEGPIQ